MLKDSNIKSVFTSVKKPQTNTPVERVHQVILNMLVTKYFDKKVFEYIDPYDETLGSIAWVVRASYRRTIMATPGQAVFGRDVLFNLASVFYWRVTIVAKQRQVDIDNVR